MIYQQDDDFKAYKFKTEIEGVMHFLDDKEVFETSLLNSIKHRMYAEDTHSQEDIDAAELPEVVYSDFSLSTDQQSRLDEIRLCSTITLDDVNSYVFNGITGNVEFNLKKENAMLKEIQAETNTTLLELMEMILQ